MSFKGKPTCVNTDLSEDMDLTLGPWMGAFVGLLAGGILTNSVSSIGLEFAWPAPWVPYLVTTILGALYGACQLRVPTRGIVAVGVFYGIFLWILTNLFGVLLFPAGAAVVRSWPGFFTYISFSLSLAVCSLVVTAMRGESGNETAQH